MRTFAPYRLASRCLTVLCLASLCAAADPLADFRAAMATEDFAAKKAAVSALGQARTGDDAQVYPLLIGALGDRQAGELALKALRSRSGLAPSGASYPRTDDAGGWGGWWSAEQQKRAQDKALKDLIKKEKDKDAPGTELFKDGQGPGTETKPRREAAPPPPAPDDLGLQDRIRLKAGGSIVVYIRSKRLDENGKLVSIRIVHADGGEETLAATLIDGIDEDIR